MRRGRVAVPLAQAKRAADWCDNYLESHARRIYSCIVNPQVRAARDLARKIKSRKVGGNESFSVRDVYLKGWTGLDTPEAVRQAIDLLEDAGWIRPVTAQANALGGRPSSRYTVNPRTWL